MAEKTVGGYLPGQDPESVMANMRYQQAQDRMRAALEARQNRFFDPQMLALAQGFLAPTQTGGFGESLGMAAKNLREAQAQEEKEERAIAEAQLGLAGQELEVERRRQREKEFQRMLGPQGMGPQAMGPSGAPTGALPGAPRGALEAPSGPQAGGALPSRGPIITNEFVAIPVAQPNPSIQTGLDYLRAAYREGTISPAEAIKAMNEIERKRYIESPGQFVDLKTGMKHVYRSGSPVDVQLFDPETGEPTGRTYKVDPGTAAALAHYQAVGDAENYRKIAKTVLEGPLRQRVEAPKPAAGEPPKPEGAPAEVTRPGEPPKPPETTPAGAPRTRLFSTEELAARAAGMEEEAKLEAKRTVGEKSEYIEAGRSVTPRLATINSLYPIASGQNAKQIFGVFERPDVASAIKTLIEGGIGSRNFQLTLPAFRKALTNAGLPQELINQAQMAYSLMAQVQLETAKLGQGQGAVSNFERDLFAQASIAATDNPAVILAKLDMLKARAELDRERSKMVRQYKGSIDDLVESAEWTRATTDYLNKISQIFGQRLAGAPVSQNPQPNIPGAAPKASGRDNQGAASRLPEGVR
jgi:hypothetical protein